MVHIRREFVKVYESYELPVAGEVMDRIAKLYGVEKLVRFKSPQERVALRQEYSLYHGQTITVEFGYSRLRYVATGRSFGAAFV
jgi:hypothetical protein